MTIKSSFFGSTVLSGKDADRLIKHMAEDKPILPRKLALSGAVSY